MAPIVAGTPRLSNHEFVAQFRVRTLHLYIRTIRSTTDNLGHRGLRKGSCIFARFLLKASMVGFSRSYYYLCVDEVPAPRSRPSPATVRQGNGGLTL
jgi:hypothetical protein